MSDNEISPSSFETPSLYLLSLLLDPDGFALNQPIPSDFGTLFFTRMDFLQERGSIPQLALEFSREGDAFRAVYYGHVSPYKLHFIELEREGVPVLKHVFSRGAEIFIPMETAGPAGELPEGLDWKIVAGSLSLWRACTGLPGICDESLGKYFSKMKSVSRYEWTSESYRKQGGDILERWSSSVPCSGNGNVGISMLLVNGVISEVVC
jgi:uncharacterized protein YkuJ